MSGRNFSLTDHLSVFIDRQVEAGLHQSASEVVREALRRYEAELALEAAHLDEIRAAAQQGIAAIERGQYVTVASSEDARAIRERINRRAASLVCEAEVNEPVEADKLYQPR
jgi:antitoxin ParD1/3/4